MGMMLMITADIDDRLDCQPADDADRHNAAVAVRSALGDLVAAVKKVKIAEDQQAGKHHAGLFGDDREDRIAADFRQVHEFLAAIPQPAAENAARSDRDQRLVGLIANLLRIEAGIHQAAEAVKLVRLKLDHERETEDAEDDDHGDMPDPPAADKIDDQRSDSHDRQRADIRLEDH